MNFKFDLFRPRERRAMVLIGAALAAIVAVSVIFLHPPASAAQVVAKAPTTTDLLPKRVVILNPGTDAYFTWRVVMPGGSGGHRAG